VKEHDISIEEELRRHRPSAVRMPPAVAANIDELLVDAAAAEKSAQRSDHRIDRSDSGEIESVQLDD